MVARRGLSVLDLLPQTSTAAGFVPDDVVERLGVLTVLEHRATTSDDFFLHEGTLQSWPTPSTSTPPTTSSGSPA